MTDRKKPGVAFWATVVVVVVPVLYVAGFGPWCWAMSRWGPIDEPDMSCSIYLPVVRAWWESRGDSFAHESIRWYANLFADPTIDPEEVAATGKIILGNSP